MSTKKLSTSSKGIIAAILFTILFLGNFFLGPITARNLLGFSLIIYALSRYRKITICKIDYAYFIYLMVMVVCSLISGVIFSETAIKGFTYHFISIAIIISFPIIFNTYPKIKFAFKFLVFLYFLNCIISILQFNNISIAWKISSFLNPQTAERLLHFTSVYGDSPDMLNHSILTGLFGFVVTNGYFAASMLPVATAELINKESSKNKIIYWGLLILGFYTIYIIQQRMGLVVGLLYISMIFIILFKKSTKVFIFISAFILIFFLGDTLLNIDLGRLLENKDPYRSHILDLFIDKFSTPYFLVGGFDLSDEFIGKTLGHNSILDAFRRGGLVTMLCYIAVFFIIAKYCFKQASVAFRLRRYILFGIWCSSLLYMIYSLTHSSGIQSGDPTFWMLASLGFSLQNCELKYKIVR